MRLTEERLKTIIREEVERRVFEGLVDVLIVEELARLGITEATEEPDVYKSYKDAAHKAFIKKLASFGLLTSMAGGIAGYGQLGANQQSAEWAAQRAQRSAEHAEYKQTPEYALEELSNKMNRSINYSWTLDKDPARSGQLGDEQPPQNFPLFKDAKHGLIGVLSPEYGVVRKVHDDIEAQIKARNELISQIEETIEITKKDDSLDDTAKKALIEEFRFEIQLLETAPLKPSVSEVIEAEGTADEWKDSFRKQLPDHHGMSTPEEDLLLDLGEAGWKWDVGVSGEYNGMTYLPYDNLSPETVLPLAGTSPSEYYIELWNEHVAVDLEKD